MRWCMVPLIHAVRIMGDITSQPCWDISGCNATYLLSLHDVAVVGNLPLQYLNSIICMFKVGSGEKGGLAKRGCFMYTSMSGCNLAEHWQRGRKQVQGSSHEGIVLYGVCV